VVRRLCHSQRDLAGYTVEDRATSRHLIDGRTRRSRVRAPVGYHVRRLSEP
jgi:hypothetical protein